MNLLIKSLLPFCLLFPWPTEFSVYNSEDKKVHLTIEKNTLYVFKNNKTCLDCYNKVGAMVQNLKCSKNLVIAKDKKNSTYLATLDFKEKVYTMNDFTFYYDKCEMKDLANIEYGKNSMFKKCNIDKTPYIITCNAAGEIKYWCYARIFSNANGSVNDTLLNQFSN